MLVHTTTGMCSEEPKPAHLALLRLLLSCCGLERSPHYLRGEPAGVGARALRKVLAL